MWSELLVPARGQFGASERRSLRAAGGRCLAPPPQRVSNVEGVWGTYAYAIFQWTPVKSMAPSRRRGVRARLASLVRTRVVVRIESLALRGKTRAAVKAKRFCTNVAPVLAAGWARPGSRAVYGRAGLWVGRGLCACGRGYRTLFINNCFVTPFPGVSNRPCVTDRGDVKSRFWEQGS
jgi:hypothetical protein